jgi:hypothetical protein
MSALRQRPAKAKSVKPLDRVAGHLTLPASDDETARDAVSNVSAITADRNSRPYSCNGIVLIPSTAGEKHE